MAEEKIPTSYDRRAAPTCKENFKFSWEIEL